MTQVAPHDLAALIHAAPVEMVLAITGGGSRAIGDLLAVPGGSRTLLEATVPYSASALNRYLGAPPEQYCSKRTARAMAMAALQRALLYGERQADQLAGIGCTASLASDRPKRGPHRVHVAVQTPRLTEAWSLDLEKGRRSRAEEEDLCARLVLNAAALAAGLAERTEVPLRPAEALRAQRKEAPAEWTDLLLAKQQQVAAGKPGAPAATAIFPGAFNPLHAGHREMIRLAQQRLGGDVALEISLVNVDKPPLDFLELDRRLADLADRHVWLTRAPTFVEKARLFPGATFIVGADTLVRIADAKYYGNDPARADAALAEIAARGCHFLVFGRDSSSGFASLSDLELPPALRRLCQGVPADQFRCDISSTAIRTQQQAE